ncbi:MAG TPA: AraC family transcriptional regulator [Planctomycetota bacterium]|nr:AraC family transcriptional regulator [Planctomycetota bacterium]
MPDARCWYSSPLGHTGQAERSQPFRIAGLSVRERMPPIYVDRPRGFIHYLFIQFDDAVEIVLNGTKTQCGPRDLIIWPPETRHYFGTMQHRWTHTWMFGSGKKAAALLASSGLPFQTPIRLDNRRLTERYFFALYEEVQRHQRPDEIIIESLLTAWLREVSRAYQARPQAEAIPERLLGVVELLQRDPAARHSLPELAATAKLSVSQFSYVFRKHFGTSPIDYLLNLRLQRAVYYLSDHNLNMTEIASRVGFNDSLYFSKQFKRRYGKSPLKYRKDVTA